MYNVRLIQWILFNLTESSRDWMKALVVRVLLLYLTYNNISNEMKSYIFHTGFKATTPELLTSAFPCAAPCTRESLPHSAKRSWEEHPARKQCSAPGAGNHKHLWKCALTEVHLPGTQPGTLWALALGPRSKQKATHNVQVGENIFLRVLSVVQVNIWTGYDHQLQMFDSSLSPLLQARRKPPCWTAQRDTGSLKCKTT